MGLDQYLHAKKFAHGGSWAKDEDKELLASLVKATNIGDFVDGDFPTASIEFKVAYWRKQNAIHNWFVQTCQDGEDDCRPAYVSREQLETLRDTCREVLADPTLAQDELPTSNGFFFGSTDYDEWYIEGLRYTVTTINKLLTMPNEWDFEYSSSW
jgi:hypothetical protein